MDLTTEEHQMLKQAAGHGGRVSISGLTATMMRQAADVAAALQCRGLLAALIHESSREASKPIDLVTVELTDAGRRYVDELE